MDKIIIFSIILIILFYFVKKSKFGGTLAQAQAKVNENTIAKNTTLKSALDISEAGYNSQMKVVISLNEILSKLNSNVNTAQTNVNTAQTNVNTATTNVSTATTKNTTALNITRVAQKDSDDAQVQANKDVAAQKESIKSLSSVAQAAAKTKKENSDALNIAKLNALNIAKLASTNTTIALDVANAALSVATEILKTAKVTKLALDPPVIVAQKNIKIANETLTQLLTAFKKINNLYNMTPGLCNVTDKPPFKDTYSSITVVEDKCNSDRTCTGFTTSNGTFQTTNKSINPIIVNGDITSSCYTKNKII